MPISTRKKKFTILLFILCNSIFHSNAQEYFGEQNLEFVKSIPLGIIQGKIGDLEINLKDQIAFITVPENNLLVVVSLQSRKMIQSIKVFDEPKHVCYIPQTKEIFVATGTTKCYFYSTDSFQKKATIRLTSGANTVKYDSAESRIYVGYGEDEIATISAITHKRIGFTLVSGTPEDLQLDKSIERLYVNMPDAYKTAVVDLKSFRVLRGWRSDNLLVRQMAVDTIQHRVFICYLKRPALAIINGKTGRKISLELSLSDIENLYYDHSLRNIYIIGNSGINIFHDYTSGFKQIANIKTATDAGPSLLIPQLRLFLVVTNAGRKNNAELLVYKLPSR